MPQDDSKLIPPHYSHSHFTYYLAFSNIQGLLRGPHVLHPQASRGIDSGNNKNRGRRQTQNASKRRTSACGSEVERGKSIVQR